MKCFNPNHNRTVSLKSKKYLLNDKFYLINIADWDEEIRDWLAAREVIQLTSEHFFIINFLRKDFIDKKVHPVIRAVTMAVKKQFGEKKGTVKYFHTLFPGGIHQAFLIAGIPMQDSCC